MLLGFDIGGTKCAVVLGKLSQEGEQGIKGKTIYIIDKVVVTTDKPVYDMIDLLFTTAESLFAKHALTIQNIDGIGISCGGPLNIKRGMVLSPPNLPGWDHIPIVEIAKKRFGKPVILQNDANACAIAEWKYGAGKGCNNLIFLTFGTGMGAGLILNGQLYTGTTDLAGEVGHLRLAENGPAGFGKEGSFEGFCSGGGLAQLAQTKVRKNLQMGRPVSFCKSFQELPGLNAKTVAEAAFNGDPVALDIYKTCGQYLGRGLSLLIDILNPEMIIIGSVYSRAKELIEPYMKDVIEQEAIPDSYAACKIVTAGLSEQLGDMAALSLAAMCETSKCLDVAREGKAV
jgi:glucokinase